MLCLGAPAAHAQGTSPVGLLDSGLADGFQRRGGRGRECLRHFSELRFPRPRKWLGLARYNFSNGFFVGSQRNTMGFGGLSQSAFGGFGSVYSEGMQFGYSLKNGGGATVTFFAGVDTLKYNSGIGSNAFAPFDSKSGTLPVSSAYGVEFQPRTNSACRSASASSSGRADRQRDKLAAVRTDRLGGGRRY